MSPAQRFVVRISQPLASFAMIVTLVLCCISPVLAQDQQNPDPLPVATAGQEYKHRFRLDEGQSAAGKLTWRVKQGALPPGLALSPAGDLAGAVTAEAGKKFVFEVAVRDASGATGSMWVALEVRAPLLIARNTPLRIATTASGLTGLSASEPASADKNLTSISTNGGDSAAEYNRTTESAEPLGSIVEGKARDIPPALHMVNASPEMPPSSGSGLPPKATLLTPSPAKEAAKAGASAAPPDDCDTNTNESDCREDFDASFFLGSVVDNFAGSEVQMYLNPEASGEKQARAVGGVSFEYRLLGSPRKASDKIAGPKDWFKQQQLWVFGETIHGARSGDVDCNQHPVFCGDFTTVPGQPVAGFSAIVRNASTLEGFFGLRWEFLGLQRGSDHAASLYAKTQAGFLAVARHPDDVADLHHVGLGALITKGNFQGSYLEAGFGRTDLFSQKKKDRWKLDGLLSRKLTEGISFFAQITVDTDVGKGADSIQSYFGFDFSFKKFKDWITIK